MGRSCVFHFCLTLVCVLMITQHCLCHLFQLQLFLILRSWRNQFQLGASPDGAVYDPSSLSQPFGFLEIKCPFKHRIVTPQEACRDPTFCCTYSSTAQHVVLKRSHPYFAQVQGQMAIGNRPWCDFVIYTTKGVDIHRVQFDEDYWKTRLPKLTAFYDNCVAPEINY